VKLAGFAILGQIRKCEGLGPVDLNKNTTALKYCGFFTSILIVVTMEHNKLPIYVNI
jgi:hypothetical protein